MPKLISDIGHIILQVGDMDEAVRLYCDTLGFDLKMHSPEWSVIATRLGELTLYKTQKITPLVLQDSEYTPISLHVISFEEAANQLEKKGYSLKRRGKNSGALTDPWGNLLELHDHLAMAGAAERAQKA